MSLGFWQRRAAVDGAAAVPAASLWVDRFHRCAVAPERQPLTAARGPRVEVASESVLHADVLRALLLPRAL